METKKHYTTKAYYIKAENFDELIIKLNDFAENKFVVAWQIFTNATFNPINCIVTYKVLEKKEQDYLDNAYDRNKDDKATEK